MQTLFDKMMSGLVDQNAFALNKDLDACQYFTPEGHKCAVGQLARSDEEAREWEEQELSVKDIAANLGISGKDTKQFLSEMQAEHDYHARAMHSFDEFLADAVKLGRKKNLNVSAFT